MKTMKKLTMLAVGITAGGFLMSETLHAQNMKDMKSMTYEGTLVDSKCYSMMPKMNAGQDHQTMGMDGKMMEVKGCATACANMGIPVGLLDKKGTMHVLAVPAGQLAPNMAKEAKVTAKEMNGVLLVDKVEVKNGGKWDEVKIVYMMK